MKWNSYDFVLSADAQWNGASQDYIRDLREYRRADLKSEYQTIVSPELHRLLPRRAGRTFESADQSTCVRVRAIDQRIGFPAEFFQCMLQKPQHYVDYHSRHPAFMSLVRNNHAKLNEILDAGFRAYYARGVSPDHAIYDEIDRLFRSEDAEMRGMLKGYLTQKPQRAIFLIDVESAPASLPWLEPVYQTIKHHLLNWGIDHIAVLTGKGYHFVTQVPLYAERGIHDGKAHLNYAMLNLMARGGPVKPETLDGLVSVRWGSRKQSPTPLLSQRSYQGMWKLQQFFLVNIADDIRRQLSRARMNPWVNFSDTEKETVILDTTSMLRQVEMGVFGSVGSLYNKKRNPPKVRIIRSRNGHEFFRNDLNWMLSTRTDLGAVKHHLVHTGGRIPDGSRGIENMIHGYDSSRMKRELHDPCDRPLSPEWISEIFQSNYRIIWQRCPEILSHIEHAQPNFLNPSCLSYVYRRLAARGFSVPEMMTITKAVYCDPAKNVQIDGKYSKDEWCRWPELLLGEWFKG
ncbi:MAG: hypothetical protein AAB229_03795 [Candidatus Hydrogenedentota bacterium]